MTSGHFDFDVCRLATSMILAAQSRSEDLQNALQAAQGFLATYCKTVLGLFKDRQPLDVDVSDAERTGLPIIDELISTAAASRRTAFIRTLTEHGAGRTHFLRSSRFYSVPPDVNALAVRLLKDYWQRAASPAVAGPYDVHDVCGRVSGIGSLGPRRLVILIRVQRHKRAREVILEFKEARQSAYDLYRRRDEALPMDKRAQQIIAFQQASQASCNRFLGFAVDGGTSWQVRELGPQDRGIQIARLRSLRELQQVAAVHGQILARIHARSAARVLGETRNPLAQLDDVDTFCRRILALALASAEQTNDDWQEFIKHREELEDCKSWAGG
jgi:uncharacterized protein (DUF2252 family)